MALPVGVLAAIYVNEFADQRVARGIKLFFDVLNGMPSIVIGIFLYVLLVVGRGQNAFIGALSLGDHHAAADLPLDPGGARARPEPPPGGQPCARRQQVADDPRA